MAEDDSDDERGFAHANSFDSSRLNDALEEDGFDPAGRYHFADRFVLAESWRIASEVVTRHPELRISRVEDEDHNPLLLLHRGSTGWRAQFDLFSGIGYQRGDDRRRFDWLTVFAQQDPFAVVKRLQVASGLRIIPAKRGETGYSLVYKTISALLAMHVSSRSTWHAVQVRLVGGSGADEDAALLDGFPTARDAADAYLDDVLRIFEGTGGQVAYWHEPLWFVYEDLQVRAVLDEEGLLHVPGGPVPFDLKVLHEGYGGEWSSLGARVYDKLV